MVSVNQQSLAHTNLSGINNDKSISHQEGGKTKEISYTQIASDLAGSIMKALKDNATEIASFVSDISDALCSTDTTVDTKKSKQESGKTGSENNQLAIVPSSKASGPETKTSTAQVGGAIVAALAKTATSSPSSSVQGAQSASEAKEGGFSNANLNNAFDKLKEANTHSPGLMSEGKLNELENAAKKMENANPEEFESAKQEFNSLFKKAFHKASLKAHPDKGGNAEAFKALNEANQQKEIALESLSASKPGEKASETKNPGNSGTAIKAAKAAISTADVLAPVIAAAATAITKKPISPATVSAGLKGAELALNIGSSVRLNPQVKAMLESKPAVKANPTPPSNGELAMVPYSRVGSAETSTETSSSKGSEQADADLKAAKQEHKAKLNPALGELKEKLAQQEAKADHKANLNPVLGDLKEKLAQQGLQEAKAEHKTKHNAVMNEFKKEFDGLKENVEMRSDHAVAQQQLGRVMDQKAAVMAELKGKVPEKPACETPTPGGANPTNSASGTNPSNPANGANPTNPANGTNPTNPANGTNPNNPANGANQADQGNMSMEEMANQIDTFSRMMSMLNNLIRAINKAKNDFLETMLKQAEAISNMKFGG